MISRKVGASGIVGAVAGLLIWASKAYGGVEVPGEVGSYITTIITFAVGYFVPNAE